MKKIILAVLSFSAFASLHAAQVAVTTPAGPGGTSYMFGSQTYDVFANQVNDEVFGSAAYNQRRDDFGLVSAMENGGEELIWLGAHETSNHNASGGVDNMISVSINNLNLNQAATGGVSLILSAAEALDWNLTLDTNVQLNNIFVFASESQSITINGQALSMDSMGEFFDQTRITRSSADCGYELPTDGEGCNTDRVLGINSLLGVDDFGDDIFSNDIDANYLADLTNLQVTNFNGSYLADAFDIDINSTATVVPVPGALVLFCSALSVLVGRKRIGK